MSRIFWDSNLFIYFLEGNDERALATKRLRKNMLDRGDQLLTSTLTLGEILVKPTTQGDQALCRLYEDVLRRTSPSSFPSTLERPFAMPGSGAALRLRDPMPSSLLAPEKLALICS